MRLVSDGGQAFVHGEVVMDHIPLAVVTHVCQVEFTVSLVTHAGETTLERGGDSIGMRTGVNRAEIEIALVPTGE